MTYKNSWTVGPIQYKKPTIKPKDFDLDRIRQEIESGEQIAQRYNLKHLCLHLIDRVQSCTCGSKSSEKT